MLRNTRKGFTLIELLIVVVIIGILAAIAIPRFSNTKEKAYVASMKADLKNLATAQEAYASDNGGNYFAGVPVNRPPAAPVAVQNYLPSAGVQVTVTAIAAAAPNPAGWNANATHASTGRNCDIFIAGGQASFGVATAEGEPKCTP